MLRAHTCPQRRPVMGLKNQRAPLQPWLRPAAGALEPRQPGAAPVGAFQRRHDGQMDKLPIVIVPNIILSYTVPVCPPVHSWSQGRWGAAPVAAFQRRQMPS